MDWACGRDGEGPGTTGGGWTFPGGNGAGPFAAPLSGPGHTIPTAAAVADFNADGLSDLVAANFFSDDVSVMLNARGAPPTASISGRVFADNDADGVLEPSDSPLNDWLVFLDANGNGLPDA